MPKLYIGNKNYSSWSMRPWVLMRQAGIAFEEVMVRIDAFDPHSVFKRSLAAVSPAGRVPVLVDGDLAIWDSLAIAEYVAEDLPQLWPADRKDRARARSICAEMHAGFTALREHCPMNIEAWLPQEGRRLWAEQPQVRADVERIVAMWTELLEQHPHPDGMLFGSFSVADAFYAPVCMRFGSYGLPANDACAAYIDRVRALPAVAQWIDEALAEHDFMAVNEPYRMRRD